MNFLFMIDKVGNMMFVVMWFDDVKNWFGIMLFDLLVEECVCGCDWLYMYLWSFYCDDMWLIGWNNVVFENVGMFYVLW